MTKPPYDFLAATFHFFQVFARRPMAALWIGFWQMVLVGLLTVGILAAVWPIFILAAETDMTDEALILQTVMQASGLFTLVGLGFVFLSLAAQGAWLRLLTREEMKPVFPFRLGLDELRLFGVNAVFVAFWFVMYLVAIIAYLGGAAALAGMDGAGGMAVGALVGTVLVLVAVVALIIVCLRFAAAPALAVQTRGFRLFSAVSASRGVAGMMFLSYLTLVGVWIAGYVIVSTVQTIAVLFGAAEIMGQIGALQTDPEAADPAALLAMLGETLASPAGVVILLVVIFSQFIFQIAFEGLWHGVGAYVARRHGAVETAAPADSASALTAPVPEPAG